MAGDWIKYETVLPEKPETHRVCDLLPDQHRAHVVGAMMMLWGYADDHGRGGAIEVSTRFMDDRVGIKGFCEAMAAVGWIKIEDRRLVCQNWDKHNADSAKTRATNTRRQQHRRAVATPARHPRDTSATQARHKRDQKRREEKREEERGAAPLAASQPRPDMVKENEEAHAADAARRNVQPGGAYGPHFGGKVPAEITGALGGFFTRGPSEKAVMKACEFAADDSYGVAMVVDTLKRMKEQKKAFMQLGPELAARARAEADAPTSVPRGTSGGEAVKRSIAARKRREARERDAKGERK